MSAPAPALPTAPETGLRLRAAAPAARAGSMAGLAEHGFALAATLIYFGVNFGLNPEPNSPPPTPGITYTLLQVFLLAGCSILVARHGRRCAAALPLVLPFGLLLLMAAFSVLWSQAPGTSFRRSVSLATLMAFAVYCHAVLGTLRTCRIHLAVMWISAAASLLVAAVLPGSGFDGGDYANAIRGVFPQKNSLGEAMTAGTLALSFVVLSRRRLRLADAAHLALSLGMTALAQSTTSLLLSAAIAGLTLLALAMSRGAAWAGLCLLVVGGTAVAVLLVLAAFPDTLLGVLGKDATLTGRTAIWAEIGRVVGSPRLFGYGYAAFWVPASPAVQTIWYDLNWPAPSAHSGYLDTVLELGMVGLGTVAAIAAATLGMAVWALFTAGWGAGVWAVVVLVALGLFNVDESSLPRPDMHMLQWMLAFMAAAAAVGRAGYAGRGRRAAVTTGPR